MTMSLRSTVLAALSVLPTVQCAVPSVRFGSTAAPVLRSRADCAGDPACTCDALQKTMTGENATLFPSDGDRYADFEDENYSAACRLPATCFVNPKSAQEVSTVVKHLAQSGTKFAIRSGGHNYIPGVGSIEEGVLVSLSSLNSVVLSGDKKTVKVGPGNRWQDVYEALVPQGLIVVGGRVGPVGVGGLTLGGGLSYFATGRGLAFDNVKSFEVVLADGTIVTATANNKYSDLYKGLRGGASNIGIVTNYELYTFPVGEFNVDARSYSANQTSDLLHAVADYQKKGQLDPLSSITIQLVDTGLNVLLLYNKAVQQADAFSAIYDVGAYTPIMPAFNGSFLDVLQLAGAQFPTGEVRTYGETFTHKADGDLMVELYDIFKEEITNLPSGASAVWVPNPVAASVATKGKQYGGNLLGLQEVPQQWYEWFITWTDPSQDSTIWDVSRKITQRCTQTTKAKGLSLPYLFMNTAGKEQDVLSSYGAASLATIKATAAKYDPNQVFQKQNDGFLLRKL
ncbi:FAD-binding domain-containing protein [Hypoxylon sp. FL1284]|nr:FAD-binding domain-containing protein [Hypoxylon sp. FL1284]